MDSNNLFEITQQGFRITLGATASFVEALRDPQKREQTLSDLRSELSQRVQEWAEKGEITEQEARRIIDELFRQTGNSQHPPETGTRGETVSTSTTLTNLDIQAELQALTAKIAELRTELEKMRQSDSDR